MAASISKTADAIARNLKVAGFSVTCEKSGLSASQYITAAIYDADDNTIFERIKIRVSDHALPPTYGALNGYADYEVGPHQEACSDWARIVTAICNSASIAIPSAVRALNTRAANLKAKRNAERAAYEAEMELRYQAWAAQRDWVDAEMVRIGKDYLTGQARKKVRYNLNAKYKAAHPLLSD